MIWLVLAAMSAVMLAFLLLPLLRARDNDPSRATFDRAIYRRQLSDLEADVERGLIAGDAAEEARREIERRILATAADGADKGARPSLRGPVAIVVAIAVPALAFLIYLQLGKPQLPGAPLASRDDRAPASVAADPLPNPVAELAERMRQQPGDARGWRLLGRSYLEIGRFSQAAHAFAQALALDETDNEARVSMAEALTLAAAGTVTPAAQASFQAALTAHPKNARARYYLGLAALQAGRPQAAYDRWLALAGDASPEAPWLDLVLHRLAQVASQLGIDLARELPPPLQARLQAEAQPGPNQADIEAAGEMSPEEREDFIRAMVDRLAARLENEPDDFDGWIRLARARQVLQEFGAAAAAFQKASVLRPDDPAPIREHARALIDGGPPDAPPPAEAIASFRRLLTLEPDNPEALWFVGLAEFQAGHIANAVSAWERLLPQLDPTTPQYKSLADEIRKARARLN